MDFHKDWLSQQVIASPKRLALIFGKDQWSFAELDEQVEQMVIGLKKLKVNRGDNVAVLLRNQANYIFLIHALARLGAILIPINIRLAKNEILWQIENSNSSVIILDSNTQKLIDIQSLNSVKIFRFDSESSLIQFIPLSEIDERYKIADFQQGFDLDNIQSIVYSSGTTGRPKGVMLSFANHFHSALASAFRLGVLPEDRWLLCMPLYHLGGMAIVFRAAIYGIAIVLQTGFEENEVIEEIGNRPITMISLVPTMLNRILKKPSAIEKLAKLRIILLGGATASKKLIKECRDNNLQIATTYGLTEAASQVATATPKQVFDKPGSVGKALLGTSLKIVNNKGIELPLGQIGEILVKGPTVMQGYYQQREESVRSIKDDHLFTGDLGYLDEDGDLWIVQRRVDLIVSGGENIYPVEIEKILLQHPAIDQVCVVGIPDKEWGQRTSAAIVLKEEKDITEEDLKLYCREHLAGFKTPQNIEFFENLPITASGKIIRKEVLSQMNERLNFQSKVN